MLDQSLLRQVQLREGQLKAFDTKLWIESQAIALVQLLARHHIHVPADRYVVDIGGGHGYFAEILLRTHPKVRVYEMDRKAIESCRARGIEADYGDALAPAVKGDEAVVCLNLILHHLIGNNEEETRRLQAAALSAWKGPYVFVHEYCYGGLVLDDLAGKVIYVITSNLFLSRIGKVISKAVPSLRANTFGIGVRFRSYDEWLRLFSDLGFEVVGVVDHEVERVSLARRLLMIRSIRRHSFLIKPPPG